MPHSYFCSVRVGIMLGCRYKIRVPGAGLAFANLTRDGQLRTCRLMPIWGAARPTPGAARISAYMSVTISMSSPAPSMSSGTGCAGCACTHI